jgi:hypothetical protein
MWKKIASAFFVTSVCTFVWCLYPFTNWLQAFVRFKDMRLPYLLI